MAKISAHGGTKLFSVEATRDGVEYRFTVTSRGRVLSQVRVDGRLTQLGGFGTITVPEKRTEAWLKWWLGRKGYEVKQ